MLWFQLIVEDFLPIEVEDTTTLSSVKFVGNLVTLHLNTAVAISNLLPNWKLLKLLPPTLANPTGYLIEELPLISQMIHLIYRILLPTKEHTILQLEMASKPPSSMKGTIFCLLLIISFIYLKSIMPPHLSHNVLSVHQLIRDNNCSISFDYNGYVFKDLTTK